MPPLPPMISEDYHDFFATSAGVAGALIGLLFVAISVAPDRLSHDDDATVHRIRAGAALTAFLNALIVSLFSLMPGRNTGGTAIVVSIIGWTFVTRSALMVRRVRRSDPSIVGDAAFLVSLAIAFGVQLAYGIVLEEDNKSRGARDTICILVIVCFIIGISRSWELIGGGRHTTVREELRELRDEHRTRKRETEDE